MDEAALDRLVRSQPDVYAREGDERLVVTLDLGAPADVVRVAEELLVRLGARRPRAGVG